MESTEDRALGTTGSHFVRDAEITESILKCPIVDEEPEAQVEKTVSSSLINEVDSDKTLDTGINNIEFEVDIQLSKNETSDPSEKNDVNDF